MYDTQQDVIIYKEGLSSAQSRFEKDLRKRQKANWRVVSVTPTKQVFGRISQLTVIYERKIDIPQKTQNSVRSSKYEPYADNENPPEDEYLSAESDNRATVNASYNAPKTYRPFLTDTVNNTEEAPSVTTDFEAMKANIIEQWNATNQSASQQWTATNQTVAQQWKAANDKKKQKNTAVGCFFGILLLLCLFGALIGNNISNNSLDPDPTATSIALANTSHNDSTPEVKPTPKPTPTATPKPKPTPKPTPTPVPFANFDDGIYIVGKDIKPGTYRTRGGSESCYYERLSGFGNTFGEIIANANTDGPAVVTIAETDKGFRSARCGNWTKDLSRITKSKTSFGEGTYIVGTDIEPGIYKSDGQGSCYYERLNGFSATFDDIIANGNMDGSAIVTITEGDKGFRSARCGTWKRV